MSTNTVAKLNKIEHIYFLNPTKNIGGNEIAFANVAKELSQSHPEIAIHIIDYKDGKMKEVMEKSDLPFTLEQYKKHTKIDTQENSIILLSSHLYRMLPYNEFLNETLNSNNDARLLLWNIDCTSYIPPFRYAGLILQKIGYINFQKFLNPILPLLYWRQFKHIKRSYQSVFDKNGCVHMSDIQANSLKKALNIEFNEKIIPVTSPPSLYKKTSIETKEDNFQFTWIGRLEGSKYYSAINTCHQINSWAKHQNKKVTLTIIGSGTKSHKLEHDITPFKQITIRHIGGLYGWELNQFLTEETDILFAVGMSMLEGCKTKTPTAFSSTDFTKKFTKNFTFFFTETSKGSLGAYSNSKENTKLTDLDNLMQQYTQEGAQEIADMCYRVYLENFSPEYVGREIFEAMNNTTLTIADLEKSNLYKKSLSEKTAIWIVERIKKIIRRSS